MTQIFAQAVSTDDVIVGEKTAVAQYDGYKIQLSGNTLTLQGGGIRKSVHVTEATLEEEITRFENQMRGV